MSKTLAPDDPRHGTANGYRNYGCRCEPCRQARAATRSTEPKRTDSHEASGGATHRAQVVVHTAMTLEEYYRRTANSTRPYGEPAITSLRADSRVGTLSGVRR